MTLRTTKHLLFVLFSFLVSAEVLVAQGRNSGADLEGTWILNKEKSDTGQYVSSATWVIKVENDKITITQDYGPKSSYENCKLILHSDNSGETNPNCFEESPKDATSRTVWKKDKLVREYQIVDTSRGSISKRKFRETLSISKSGRLVFEHRSDLQLPAAAQEPMSPRDHPTVSLSFDVYTFVFDKKN